MGGIHGGPHDPDRTDRVMSVTIVVTDNGPVGGGNDGNGCITWNGSPRSCVGRRTGW